jgi:lactoylglutathione lyase
VKFLWITINVKDMEKSMAFYRDVVGLNVDRTMNPAPGMQIAFLGSGETKVELISDPQGRDRSYGKDLSIGFEVESIESIAKALEAAHVKIESGPHQPNPMLKFIYVLDPDGVRVQFVENIRPNQR